MNPNLIYELCAYPKGADRLDFKVEVTLDKHNLALILNQDMPLYACYACYEIDRDQANRLLQYEGSKRKITDDQEAFIEVVTRR